MPYYSLRSCTAFALISGLCFQAHTDEVSSLRLVPFPKRIELHAGVFKLDRSIFLETANKSRLFFGELIEEELRLAGFEDPRIRIRENDSPALRLSAKAGGFSPAVSLRDESADQDYVLIVQPDAVTIQSPGTEGLVYGIQTLRQLIRANLKDNAIPCLTIEDWPSIRWRAFQDDLTRGPSTRLDYLKREIDLGSFLRMNIFTYYMEYQFAHEKHPKIGPEDGSLTPAEVRELVAHGAPLQMNIMGNQQSFAHFEKILSHEEYAPLRETSHMITPANEATYQLLDDLYADQIPLLPFGFFNVCCDETSGIGQGPAKGMAEQYGVGGTYVEHILRVYDLIRNQYGRRMMMWGDIILKHPDRLEKIPKDVIMMTWGYGAKASFEDQIIPFADSGYDFFVCPGVNSWSVILPHFSQANTNIRNFVRDGLKHGCIGVLNTDWDDDGRTFNAVNVHGYGWGAECSWNGSKTSLEDFNRRIGAVLFGEKGNHFGMAIELLSQLGYRNNKLFFDIQFEPFQCKSIEQGRAELLSDETLRIVRNAMEHLSACQRNAVVNRDILYYFIFGARRLELIAQREIDRFEAAVAYREAAKLPSQQAKPKVAEAIKHLRRAREAHVASRERFKELWLRENKPYALDWAIEGGHKVYNVRGSYNGIIGEYDKRLSRLNELVEEGGPLPPGAEVGLGLELQSARGDG